MTNRNPSRSVSSTQQGPHENLEQRVLRARETQFERPIAPFNQAAFDAVQSRWTAESKPDLVLDAACGTAQSTIELANRHPEALVIGVDKSEHRLRKTGKLPGNAMVVRADLIDFWRLALDAQWRLSKHYVFFPNPWPKPSHLTRRWHAHAVFPTVLRLGGDLELRTNWRIYAEEFVAALAIYGYEASVIEYTPDQPLTPFETKYWRSGHDLYQVRLSL